MIRLFSPSGAASSATARPFFARCVAPALMLASSLVLPLAAQAQTKPRVQVPAEEQSQSRRIVRQLLREGKIMRASEVRRGMKGYGLSVFQGTKLEKFPIEIIGVLEKVMGGGDLILIKVTGGTVVKRQSGIIAGMSGSPVYINGKMLGAIAIGFGFPKEPIGGVTPITQMIETSLPDAQRRKIVAPSGKTTTGSAANDTKIDAKSDDAGKSNDAGKGEANNDHPNNDNARDDGEARENAQDDAIEGAQARTSARMSTHVRGLKAAGFDTLEKTSARMSTHVRDLLRRADVYRPKAPLFVAGRNITRVVVSRDPRRAALSGDMLNATMTMRPASTLLQVSGISPSSLSRLRRVFEPYGIEPVLGASGAGMMGASGSLPMQAMGPSSRKTGVNPPFIPGGAIAVQLVSGDVDMSGVGTITFRWGKRILAFGHPMFGIGNVSIPMATAYVHEIFPSYQSSFKLASPVKSVGALQQDNNFAIGGTIGMKAETIPMRVSLRNPARQINKTYRVQMMKDPLFTPLLAQSVAFETLSSTLGMDSDKMVRVGFKMQLENGPTIVRHNYIYAQDEVMFASLSDMFDSLMLTQMNSFGRGAIKSMSLDVAVEPMRKTARIKRIFADRNKIKAGETFRVNVVLEPHATPGKTITRTFQFSVPADAPSGSVRVGAAPSSEFWTLQNRVGEAPPRPTNLRELLAAYEKIGAADELMVQASTPRTYLLIDRNKVPNAPPTWSKLLRGASSTSVGAYNEVQTRRENSQYALSGMQGLTIPVESLKLSEKAAPDTASKDTATLSSSSSGESSMPMPEASSVPPTMSDDGSGMISNAIDSDAKLDALVRALQGDRKALPSLRGMSTHAGGTLAPTSFNSAMSMRERANAWRQSMMRAQLETRSNRAAGDTIVAPTPVRPITPSITSPGATANPTPAPTPAPAPAPAPTPAPDEGKNLGRPAQRWIQSTSEDFARGDFNGTQVLSDGTIQLATAGRMLATTTEPFAWSIAADNRGNTYLGTGNEARIIRIDARGATTTIYNGPEVAVTALATDASGNLYAGVSPGGRVMRFGANGVRTTILNTGQTFVWALEFDEQGRLMVGTGGERGALYRLDDVASVPAATGRSTPLATLPQRHIRALSSRGNDIFAGTGADGVLYQVDGTSGASRALYQVSDPAAAAERASQAASGQQGDEFGSSMFFGGGSSVYSLLAAAEMANMLPRSMPQSRTTGTEILSVAAAPDGVYFGTSLNGAVQRWNQAGVATIYTAKDQQSIYALRRAPNGNLYAAAGDKGAVYQLRPAANPGDTKAARVLDPTQLQALSLAITPGGDLVVGTGNNAAAYQIPLGRTGTGTFLSNVFDAKNIVQWGALRVTGDNNSVETRSGNTLEPDASWSAWQVASTNDLGESRVASPPARYLQYRVKLNGAAANGAAANASNPALSRVEVLFRAKNSAPTVSLTLPRGGEYLKGKQKLTWSGQDADEDTLRYKLSLSDDNGATWKAVPLTDATAATFEVDTSKYHDGLWRARIEANDAARNPDDPQRAELVSLPFTLDNTAPVISNALVALTNAGAIDGTDRTWTVRANVLDALSPISGAEWRIAPPVVKAAVAGATTATATSGIKATTGTTSRPMSTQAATKAASSATKAASSDTQTTPAITLANATPTAATAAAATAAAATPGAAKPAGADWQASAALDSIFDSRREEVVANVDLSSAAIVTTAATTATASVVTASGSRKVELRARDAAGNVATITLPLP